MKKTILLQSFDSIGELVELDPDSRNIQSFCKVEHDNAGKESICGFYATLGDKTLAFYLHEDHLYFQVNESYYVIAENPRVELDYKGVGATLRLEIKSDTTLKISYERPILVVPLEEDPTPFVEEEDFDFGLFIFNILTHQARKERLIERWRSDFSAEQ